METNVFCDLTSDGLASNALDEISPGSVPSALILIVMVLVPREATGAHGWTHHLCKNCVFLLSSLPPSAPPKQIWYASDELPDLASKPTSLAHRTLSGRQSWAC